MQYFAFSDELASGQSGWVVAREDGADCTEDSVVGFYLNVSSVELLAQLQAQGVNSLDVEVDE